MKHPRRTHAVTFRVTEDEYNQIALAALEAGQTPTDWCRDVCIERSESKDRMMSEGQRLLFEEVAALRFLVGNAFGAHAAGTLTKESWAEIRKTSRERAKEHANTLLAHYESKWFFRDGEARPREPKVIDEGEAPEA